jgi:hypothetical protein
VRALITNYNILVLGRFWKWASSTGCDIKFKKYIKMFAFFILYFTQVQVAAEHSMANTTTMDTEENLIQLETPVATSSEIKVTASNHLELGLMYKQSHAARESANPICATIFNNDNTVKFESGPMTRIGGLDWPGEPETLKTFHGGRIAKGNDGGK